VTWRKRREEKIRPKQVRKSWQETIMMTSRRSLFSNLHCFLARFCHYSTAAHCIGHLWSSFALSKSEYNPHKIPSDLIFFTFVNLSAKTFLEIFRSHYVYLTIILFRVCKKGELTKELKSELGTSTCLKPKCKESQTHADVLWILFNAAYCNSVN